MVSAAVMSVHLTGILVGGGLSVASDRWSLQLRPGDGQEVQRDLARLYAVHRWVIAGLGITIASGVLMLLADLHTYVTSPLYWTKMGLADSAAIGRIAVDPTNSQRVFAAATGHIARSVKDRGLYRTTDGGQTWTAAPISG